MKYNDLDSKLQELDINTDSGLLIKEIKVVKHPKWPKILRIKN